MGYEHASTHTRRGTTKQMEFLITNFIVTLNQLLAVGALIIRVFVMPSNCDDNQNRLPYRKSNRSRKSATWPDLFPHLVN